VDIQSGHVRWNRQFQGVILQLAVGSESVFAAESTGTLHAMDLHTGEITSQKPVDSESAPILVSGEILVLSEIGKGRRAIDAATGKTIWRKTGSARLTPLHTAGSRDDPKIIFSDAGEARILTLDAYAGDVDDIEENVFGGRVLHRTRLVYYRIWEVGGDPLIMLHRHESSVFRGPAPTPGNRTPSKIGPLDCRPFRHYERPYYGR
jgi:outer membrane protein assembly factor BamB